MNVRKEKIVTILITYGGMHVHRGVIKYYTQPPAAAKTTVESALVSEMSQEFDIDSVASKEGSMMKALPTYRPSQTMVVETLGPVAEVRENENLSDDDAEEMEDDSEEEESGEQLVSNEGWFVKCVYICIW